jgi:signal transduction histidine kinase
MVAGNWLFLLEPDPSISNFITQSYTLVPILIVSVVFIAWQYNYKIVMLYAAVTNLSDFIITFLIVDDFSLGNISLLSLPIIRGFTFMLVGFIVDQLNEQQRIQKHKLVLANIQLGQYANTLESLAISRERNRLARELHDILAHTLSGISVNLEALKTMVPEEDEEANAMIDRSLADARQGLANTRRALQDLRAQPLEDLGLELALQALIENLAERQGIETGFLFTSPVMQLPPNVEQAFYRIGQESIENIAEHAYANKIFFELDEKEGLVHMEIRDDGVGFDLSSKPEPGHYGIQGMKERATSIGADLDVESHPGKGTTVRLLWERLI